MLRQNSFYEIDTATRKKPKSKEKKQVKGKLLSENADISWIQ